MFVVITRCPLYNDNKHFFIHESVFFIIREIYTFTYKENVFLIIQDDV